jgi:hypothetical protein
MRGATPTTTPTRAARARLAAHAVRNVTDPRVRRWLYRLLAHGGGKGGKGEK